MASHQKRPVFLNLLTIRLPVAGVMSIGHRITGVLMTLATPFFIYLLDLSLRSPEGFDDTALMLSGGWGRLLLFVAAWAVLHHLFAGVRYLLIDLDLGVEKPLYRISALAVMIAAPLAAAAVVGVLA